MKSIKCVIVIKTKTFKLWLIIDNGIFMTWRTIKQPLIDGLEWCGLLWCFYQLFGLLFWRHPFTAEHPLLRQWCNVTFLQIWWRHKLIYVLDDLREGEYIFNNFHVWVNYSLKSSGVTEIVINVAYASGCIAKYFSPIFQRINKIYRNCWSKQQQLTYFPQLTCITNNDTETQTRFAEGKWSRRSLL